MGRRTLSILAAAGLASVGFIALPASPATAATQVTISGSSRQLTTDPAAQIDPAISGNAVAYTDYRSGNAEISNYNLATGMESADVTSASALAYQILGDVSGSTIVYTEFSAGGAASTVKALSLGGATIDVAGDTTAANPGIDGTLVAWEDVASGTKEIYAADLGTSPILTKHLTSNTGNDSTDPNVSGRNIVYSTHSGTACQVFDTNFDTGVSTQLTSSTGCNSSADISGNHVVYQSTRDPSAQNIYVFDLATNTEAHVALPGLQRNPHVSGDWVSFEDVTSTGFSSIRLYYIPTGQIFTAVQATTSADSAYLNDISGTNVAYTSNAAGNADIYVFAFTVTPTGPSDLATVVNQLLAAGCLDNSGISNALIAKLSAAQAAINAGDLKTAINILTAFINQVQAQSGKHILGPCTVAGVTINNPAAVLITDAQSIINSLTVAADPNPITGSVMTSTGSPVGGATLSLVDSTGTTRATATSDVTGFYYFATTGLLSSGASYSVSATTLPSGFTNASPGVQTFTWGASATTLSSFTLT